MPATVGRGSPRPWSGEKEDLQECRQGGAPSRKGGIYWEGGLTLPRRYGTVHQSVMLFGLEKLVVGHWLPAVYQGMCLVSVVQIAKSAAVGCR